MLNNLPPDLIKLTKNATWEQVTEGESDADVYRLRADSVRYLKISSSKAQYPAKNDYLRLKWLTGKLPTPDILYYQEDKQYHYLLMSDCAGLHPLHDDLQWTAQTRLDVLLEAVQIFHALPIDDCPYRMGFDEQIALARHNIDYDLVRIDFWEEEHIGRDIEDLFAEFVALRPQQEDWVLTHGDMYPINIRVAKQSQKITGFIDVGAMAVADSYTDLVCLSNAIGWHHGSLWVDRFWTQLGSPINEKKLRFYKLFREFI
ncbi:MAG: hypothetical protein Phog2KO_31610 [Phototrophicaceae bacterium]